MVLACVKFRIEAMQVDRGTEFRQELSTKMVFRQIFQSGVPIRGFDQGF